MVPVGRVGFVGDWVEKKCRGGKARKGRLGWSLVQAPRRRDGKVASTGETILTRMTATRRFEDMGKPGAARVGKSGRCKRHPDSGARY